MVVFPGHGHVIPKQSTRHRIRVDLIGRRPCSSGVVRSTFHFPVSCQSSWQKTWGGFWWLVQPPLTYLLQKICCLDFWWDIDLLFFDFLCWFVIELPLSVCVDLLLFFWFWLVHREASPNLFQKKNYIYIYIHLVVYILGKVSYKTTPKPELRLNSGDFRSIPLLNHLVWVFLTGALVAISFAQIDTSRMYTPHIQITTESPKFHPNKIFMRRSHPMQQASKKYGLY